MRCRICFQRHDTCTTLAALLHRRWALLAWHWGAWMVPGEWVDPLFWRRISISIRKYEPYWTILFLEYFGHVMSIFVSNDDEWHCWYTMIYFYSSSSDWIRRRQPPSAAAFASEYCMRTINGPAPLVRILSNSQLANLRRTNHYLILDRYGQIDSCSHDIVDVRPTGCLVNACACLPFSLPASERRRPFLRRAEKLPFSLFQHLSTVCICLLFPSVSCIFLRERTDQI